jgi:hypothetical protein
MDSIKKLLSEYKKSINENFDDYRLIETLVDDAAETVHIWLEIDINEFNDSDKKTQYDFVNNDLDNYIDDVYDDIESELPKGISVEKWVKRNRKKIISKILKEIT